MSEYDVAVLNARLDGWLEEEAEWCSIRKMTLEATRELGLEGTPTSMDAIGPYRVVLFGTAQKRDEVASLLQKKTKQDFGGWLGYTVCQLSSN